MMCYARDSCGHVVPWFCIYCLCQRKNSCFYLSVCRSDYSKSREQILVTFFGVLGHGSSTNPLDFGGSLDDEFVYLLL